MNSNNENDKAFLNRLTSIVEANLSDENFGVNELAKEVGLSRSQIHRKLKSVCNKSVSQFLREVRLDKAKLFLEDAKLTVSEIAYKVGFGSPSYFIKCFHDQFGYPPGEVKKLTSSENLSEDDSTNNRILSGKAKNVSALKIVPFAVIILLLVWVGFDKFLNHRTGDLSIIVLPFNNLSDDPANEYFADGIREDILNNLYRISSLRVLSNTTAENFRETNLTAQEIAHLDACGSYVLEGSVRRYE